MMMKLAEHVACMEGVLLVYRILLGTLRTEDTTRKP